MLRKHASLRRPIDMVVRSLAFYLSGVHILFVSLVVSVKLCGAYSLDSRLHIIIVIRLPGNLKFASSIKGNTIFEVC